MFVTLEGISGANSYLPAITVAPVPLPAGMALMLTGLWAGLLPSVAASKSTKPVSKSGDLRRSFFWPGQGLLVAKVSQSVGSAVIWQLGKHLVTCVPFQDLGAIA